MFKQSIALLASIVALNATVQPAIARPMTSAETQYLGQLNRLSEYHTLLKAGATKQAVIDMGWRSCNDDNRVFTLMTQMQWLEQGNTASTRENLLVSLVGGAVAVKHLCPEQRSAYGDALNSMQGYSVEGRQMLWAIAK